MCQVQIGIEIANAGDPETTQPLTVNLYSGPVGFPTAFPGSFPLVGTSGSVDVGDQTSSLFNINVNGTALFGEELIVEIFTPDGQTEGHAFFIGSNNDGESDPSYLRAPDCGVTSPATAASLDAAQMHIVMTVFGTEIPLTPTATATNTPTVTNTPTATNTPTVTSTPTPTNTPGVSGPDAPEVPTLSSVGQALMTLVLLGLGIAILLRRRG